MRRLNDLLNYVKNNLTKQKTLSNVFEAYAKENNLNKYSVRNLYYYGLKELEEKGEGKSEFKRKKLVRFTKTEAEKLFNKIEENKKRGISVRKSCLMFSSFNKEESIRLINKYRLEKKKREKVCAEENVVMFSPRKQVISDSDIASLFSGLVRLIRENASREAGVDREEIKRVKEGLNRANEEIKELRIKLREEKSKNERLISKV